MGSPETPIHIWFVVYDVSSVYSIRLTLSLLFVGLRRENPINMAWSSAVSSPETLSGASMLTEADIKKARSSWPITLFMAIIISAPYFIWRIISSLDSPPEGIGKMRFMLVDNSI